MASERFTQEQQQFILGNYPEMSANKIGKVLGAKPDTVIAFLRRKGVAILSRAESICKLSAAKQVELVRRRRDGLTLQQLMAEFGVNRKVVENTLRRHKARKKIKPKGKLTPEQELEIVRAYRDGKRVTFGVAVKFGITTAHVSGILKRHGVRRRSCSEAARRCELNEAAFDRIGVEEWPSYFAGLLMADGTVNDRGKFTPQIALRLEEADLDLVRTYRAFLGSTHKIGRIVRTVNLPQGTPFLSRMVGLTVTSQRIVDALARIGVVPRKSESQETRFLGGLESNRHAWRGVIDGDGVVCLGRSHGILRASVTCLGSLALTAQFATFVRTLVPDYAGKPSWAKSLWSVQVTGGSAMPVVRALYGDATVALPRKWEIAKRILAECDEGGRIGSTNTYRRKPHRRGV